MLYFRVFDEVRSEIRSLISAKIFVSDCNSKIRFLISVSFATGSRRRDAPPICAAGRITGLCRRTVIRLPPRRRIAIHQPEPQVRIPGSGPPHLSQVRIAGSCAAPSFAGSHPRFALPAPPLDVSDQMSDRVTERRVTDRATDRTTDRLMGA